MRSIAIVTLIASCLSAVLYRMGGAKGYNTKFRDIGCPLVLIGATIALFGLRIIGSWWAYLLCFGLSWGALTTYWDWLFKEDNFYAHGFGCSLATIPLLWCGVPWFILLIHAVICTVGMGLWHKVMKNAVVEELGRGFLFVI